MTNTPPKVVCNRCTYDLTGHASDGPITCPECGKTDAARVETFTPSENNAVLGRCALALTCVALSFIAIVNVSTKASGLFPCILVGAAVACVISARRHSRGSNTFLANVVFILVGVYTVLLFAMAIGARWG